MSANAEEKESILSSIEKINRFPTKISYDVMIPLSKIAFCQGQLIHTNEFKLLQPRENEKSVQSIPFCSYSDVIESLRKRLGDLELADVPSDIPRRSSLKGSLSTPKGRNDENLNKKSVQINELKNDYREIPPVGSEQKTSVFAMSQRETEPENSETVFEIREYLDDDKPSNRFELVDVTKQLNYLDTLSPEPTGPQSEDDSFIREISLIADRKASNPGNDRKSPRENIAELEALLSQLEKTQWNLDRKAEGSSGWKPGFFSSGGQKKSLSHPKASTTSVAPAHESSYPPSSSSSIPNSFPPRPATQTITSGRTSNDNNPPPGPSAGKRKAFSGVIMEKFP